MKKQKKHIRKQQQARRRQQAMNQSHNVPLIGQKKIQVSLDVVGHGRLEPKEDMTAQEAANIAVFTLFVAMQGAIQQPIDFDGFIKDKNLTRHFTPFEEIKAHEKALNERDKEQEQVNSSVGGSDA